MNGVRIFPDNWAPRALLWLLLAAGGAAGQEWIDGLSEPETDATLAFQTGGVLAKLSVTDGQEVKQGELLAELDNEQETLEVARRELVVQAAKKDYERTKQVFDNGKSVSRDELEQKEASYKVAEVEYEIARALLQRRKLLAPCDGVVTDHFSVDPGESIQANAPVIRLVNPNRCRFTCHVPGSAAHGLAVGRAVTLQFEVNGSTVTVEGVVEFVSPTVDAASGLRMIKARFDNPQRAVPPGLTGKLKVKPA